MKRRNTQLALAGLVALFVVVLFVTAAVTRRVEVEPEYGATFSLSYANYLGIDWKAAYRAGLEELDLNHWRLPVAWSDVEPEKGQYNFSDIDFMMDLAHEHDAKVVLAVGVKVPRWPECFLPEWTEGLSDDAFDVEALSYVTETVLRYKEHPALDRWQVENEPFFPFGECPTPDAGRVQDMYGLVRSLDDTHEIQTTTSGEQSFWSASALRADVLGVSLYREVKNPTVGTFVFPHTPGFYRVQKAIAELFVDRVIISELQAEPWIEHEDLITKSPAGVYASFPAEDLASNVAFAKQIGATEIYFWGVEWWYFLKEHGESGLWDQALAILP